MRSRQCVASGTRVLAVLIAWANLRQGIYDVMSFLSDGSRVHKYSRFSSPETYLDTFPCVSLLHLILSSLASESTCAFAWPFLEVAKYSWSGHTPTLDAPTDDVLDHIFLSSHTTHLFIMSYAEAAAKGPKQSAEEVCLQPLPRLAFTACTISSRLCRSLTVWTGVSQQHHRTKTLSYG